ncbi:Low molecular weight phosphotyrosine protein phosphatase domain protein [Leptospira santarosai]|uniref:Low molecular weight phosphotyrosine protein phosphatase domain protein n=1 Tax=Leptospira santarosai TaxID=28183 RepID=A0A2P1QWD1_9LEPT|nr:Low molecular weight phosphotyrosine protein phosphatase domain protein [Leptospira santarosai]
MSDLYGPISLFLKNRETEIHLIDDSRKKILSGFSKAVKKTIMKNNCAKLIFICTHNSRRSQIAQMIALASAEYLDMPEVEAYSGGTEVTEFYNNSVQALSSIGFRINKKSGNVQNPRYIVAYKTKKQPVVAFSKLYSDSINPKEKFIVVMVCSSADETCPYVPGAEKRISLPYSDPKAYDNKDEVSGKYIETCETIAREILFVFQNVK